MRNVAVAGTRLDASLDGSRNGAPTDVSLRGCRSLQRPQAAVDFHLDRPDSDHHARTEALFDSRFRPFPLGGESFEHVLRRVEPQQAKGARLQQRIDLRRVRWVPYVPVHELIKKHSFAFGGQARQISAERSLSPLDEVALLQPRCFRVLELFACIHVVVRSASID